jgi:hypothetical protein
VWKPNIVSRFDRWFGHEAQQEAAGEAMVMLSPSPAARIRSGLRSTWSDEVASSLQRNANRFAEASL